MDTVKPCKALDLGCGQGRNALFLAQQGFDVTAVDQNELSLEILQSIVEQEDLEMPVGIYDINSASIGQTYDFIVSTVVLMFYKQIAFQLLSKHAGTNLNWWLQFDRLCHGHGGLSLLSELPIYL